MNMYLELEKCMEEQGYLDMFKTLRRFDTIGIFTTKEALLILGKIVEILNEELREMIK